MKINLLDMKFSGIIVVFLVVLLVYTFYFTDEELLVSLLTTFVLVGGYNMMSSSLNNLFLSDINDAVRKLSLYLMMNLMVLEQLSDQIKNVYMLSNYLVIYVSLFERTLKKVHAQEHFFVNSVNFMVQNIAMYVLATRFLFKHALRLKIFASLRYFDTRIFSKMFSTQYNLSLKKQFLAFAVRLIVSK